jgi:hypothetical protein
MSADPRSQTAATGDQLQAKPRVEFAAVVRATAGEARDGTAYAADARKFLPAIWTSINETRRVSSCRKREIMTALFSFDSKIATRLLPLLAMREYPSPARTKLSQKMGHFMAESAIDFGRMLKQSRI